MFFGDSITAGFGIGESNAFPAVLQGRLDSLGIPARVLNAGLSGETTAGGLRRIDWILRDPVDLLVVELGGNDGLRGVATESTARNLTEIIERARKKQPGIRVVLAGMQIPPNLGATYAASFRDLFPEVAEETGVELIPFLLEGVGGDPRFNLGDGIHPNEAGHRRIEATVWAYLEDDIRSLSGQSTG